MSTKCKYEELGGFTEGLASVRQNKKLGYINTSGEEVIKCQFTECRNFHNGVAQVAVEGKWGLIDKLGNFLIPPVFNMVSYYSEGSIVCENSQGMWSYMGLNGEMAIDNLFSEARPFESGIAIVKIDNRYGAIDKLGNTVIPFEFDHIDTFGRGNDSNVTGACKNGKYGVIDRSGNTIIDFEYDYLHSCFNGLITVGFRKNLSQRKLGVITYTGETIIPCIYDNIDCGEEVIAINIGEKVGYKYYHWGKWGWADLQGNVVVEPKYGDDNELFFSEGLANVAWRRKFGFVDTSDKIVIPFKYDHAYNFYNGIAYVMKNCKFGYINKEGDVVIPLIYDFLSLFGEGYSVAKLNGKSFYIDQTGKRVLF